MVKGGRGWGVGGLGGWGGFKARAGTCAACRQTYLARDGLKLCSCTYQSCATCQLNLVARFQYILLVMRYTAVRIRTVANLGIVPPTNQPIIKNKNKKQKKLYIPPLRRRAFLWEPLSKKKRNRCQPHRLSHDGRKTKTGREGKRLCGPCSLLLSEWINPLGLGLGANENILCDKLIGWVREAGQSRCRSCIRNLFS